MVAWAETNEAVLVTLKLADCDTASPVIEVTENHLKFEATTKEGAYKCDLELKFPVKPEDENTKYTITGRDVKFHLVKKEEERWNGLLKNKKLGKNLVAPDWDAWVDSDDEDKDAAGFDMSQFGGAGGGMPGMGGGGMPGMGGMGGGMPGMGGGMPGMGGMGGMPGMGGMGGAGGMGGMDMEKLKEMMAGMGGMGGMGGAPDDGDAADEDDDDDDLPDLVSDP